MAHARRRAGENHDPETLVTMPVEVLRQLEQAVAELEAQRADGRGDDRPAPSADPAPGPGHGLAWLAAVSALLACIAGNGPSAVAWIGITTVVDPHAQTAAISLFSLLTLAFAFRGYRNHQHPIPLLLAGLGTLLVLGTAYVTFSKPIESIGFAALIGSGVLSWQAGRQAGT